MKNSRLVLAVVCLSSLTAFAQQEAIDGGASSADAPAPAVPPEPLDAGVTVAVVPASAVTPVLPEAVLKVLSMFRVYGTFKPTIAASSAATESFSQPNMSAITAAGNPVFSSNPASAQLSFQMAQSRLGFWFGEGTPYRGQFEMDFIDFTKASPTVASVPRLRVAKLEWSPTSAITIMAGQDWGLEQPVNPHGTNLVGGGFEAGNTGFMRQQVKFLAKLSDFELGIAAGLQTNNNTAKDGLVEQSFTPTAAVRAQYNINNKGRVGISAIVTSVLLRGGTDPERALAGEAGLYGDISVSKDFNIRFEAYMGQNAANLFTLGLGQGHVGATEAVNVREVGGFASTRFTLVGPVSLFATLGAATVLDPENVAPSYGYAGTIDPAMPPAFSTATLSGTGPGITFNVQGRLGFDVKIGKGLSFIAEGFWYRTRFNLQAVDIPRAGSVAQTFGTEFGFMWMF